MDVVFFGSGAFGLPTLRALAGEHRLVAVVSQPDRPAGRGGKTAPTPVSDWAAGATPAVPLYRPERLAEPAELARVGGLRADALVVIAYGQKLPRALLGGTFAINLHASLLPRWRGAAPINAAILAGDSETGNSVITLAERMDAGAVLAQSRRPIDPTLTAGELHDALAEEGPALVLAVLDGFRRRALAPREQDESLVTLAPRLSRADSWLDFARGAEACRRRIHGLTPWPGVTADLAGEPLKLLRVQPAGAGGQGVDAGTLVDTASGLVACGEGPDRSLLRLLEVQPAGKRAMDWEDFIRGRRIVAGARLAAPPPPPPAARPSSTGGRS